jgi:hypothetical protein
MVLLRRKDSANKLDRTLPSKFKVMILNHARAHYQVMEKVIECATVDSSGKRSNT